jgi:hypothetical protein
MYFSLRYPGRRSRFTRKERALWDLKILRKGTTDPVDFLNRLFYNLFMRELTLEEIGTNREELLNLLRRNLALAIEDLLYKFRNGLRHPSFLTKKIKYYLQIGGFTLEDFSSSEEELEELTRRYYIEETEFLEMIGAQNHSVARLLEAQ